MTDFTRAAAALASACGAVLLVAGGCRAGAPLRAAAAPPGGPRPRHIFVIMMENRATEQIIGNTAAAPYLNRLAGRYGVATNYFGVTHPSLPNYLALISGDFQGIWDDCPAGRRVTCAPEAFVPGAADGTAGNRLPPAERRRAARTAHWFAGRNLVDQLEAHGLTWKAYMQALPAVGFTGAYAPAGAMNGQPAPPPLYAQKHNPFLYFADIRNNPTRMRHVVPFTQLDGDLASGAVPNFVWISPDLCNDMHGLPAAAARAAGIPDCGWSGPTPGVDPRLIAGGDRFLRVTVPAIMRSGAWRDGAALVVVWDEDDFSSYAGCCGSPTGAGGVTLGGGRAPIIIVTSGAARHLVDSRTPYNHYALLATIEHLWGLGCLAHACGVHGESLMTKFFARNF